MYGGRQKYYYPVLTSRSYKYRLVVCTVPIDQKEERSLRNCIFNKIFSEIIQWLSIFFSQAIFSTNNLIWYSHVIKIFSIKYHQWWKCLICISICYNSNSTLYPICSTTNILMSFSFHILVYYWFSGISVSTTLHIFMLNYSITMSVPSCLL